MKLAEMVGMSVPMRPVKFVTQLHQLRIGIKPRVPDINKLACHSACRCDSVCGDIVTRQMFNKMQHRNETDRAVCALDVRRVALNREKARSASIGYFAWINVDP